LAGVLLHRFVLQTAEVDAMMFSPSIHGIRYGYAALLTLLFSGIVMVSMHYKLKRIDMIEALKSVE
jgi:putative ABC transport system permease protein